MEGLYLTKLDIVSVRHLRGIEIPLSETERKHLILTGKNGSGKTSVLESLRDSLEYIVSNGYVDFDTAKKNYEHFDSLIKQEVESEEQKYKRAQNIESRDRFAKLLEHWNCGAVPLCVSFTDLREKYKEGKFVLAYYGDERRLLTEQYKNIEKVDLQPYYTIQQNIGTKLAKYLVDLKATQAFAQQNGEPDVEKQISEWFDRFAGVLRDIFDDPSLELKFDSHSFQFTILQAEREPFGFNTLSSGYAAALEIVGDLIMRMEAQRRMRMDFDLEGVVLIDEIETHMHLELQKKILPILTKLFPNIQFIVSTHSPFILNSLGNVVIYDLEKKILVAGGMQNLPYEGIVEGYFGADRLSRELREKMNRYVELVHRDALSDADYAEIEELEYYLDEVPDYLASDIMAEYSRLKLEFANRG